jgi:hypothetical protein
MTAYTVQQVEIDPPRFAMVCPLGYRVTRPVPAENEPTMRAVADLCNEIRRRTLEERKEPRNGSPNPAHPV